MKLIDVNTKIDSFLEKGYSIGVTEKDYTELTRTVKKAKQLFKEDEMQKLYDEYLKIRETLYKNGLFDEYNRSNVDYIREHSHILPLVLANTPLNTALTKKGYKYAFSCHFETNPIKLDMYVLDMKNRIRCYGCGAYYNPIDYLKYYEGTTGLETIALLSSIFLISKDIELNDRTTIDRYRKTVLSYSYRDLLSEGLEKSMAANIEGAEEHYKKRIEDIERIKNKEYDPNFTYIPKPKLIRFEKTS